TLAVLSHILTFVAPIVAPLIIYLLKKDESKYIAHHAKESLNFQITLMIIIVGLFLSVVGILFIWIPGIVAFVLVIIATIRASEGTLYKYPFTLRLIK
ncbi:MAG: putative transrane protein, partial [Segetibacter sp.]|nr:putative transrane protein [Segetibacter sp.]